MSAWIGSNFAALKAGNIETTIVIKIEHKEIINIEDGLISDGIELKKYWANKKLINKKANLIKNFKNRSDLKIPENKYLNTTCILGIKKYIIEFLEFVKNNLYQENKYSCYFAELNYEICSLDIKSEIFGTLSGLKIFQHSDSIYYKFQKNRIMDIRSSKKPCILCFPNNYQDFNLRMHKYGNFILKNVYHHNINYYELFFTILSFAPMIFMNKFTLNYFFILFSLLLFFAYYFLSLYL